MIYVLGPNREWSRGFLVGRYPGHLGVGEHLAPGDADKVGRGDTVFIIGDWDDRMQRAERVRIEKALHDSGARLRNGAGLDYSWGWPKPWEHEATTRGETVHGR